MNWNEQSPIIQSARRILSRLRDEGYTAYWVGGCVRDAILGLEPGDIDIACDAHPEKIQELFPKTLAVGAQFGVVLVVEDDVETEVATFRSDGAYLDSRHPTSVTFGTAQEDAKRRDFTINVLLYDPVKDDVLDFVGGQEDLRLRVLRAIGDPRERFKEDALRLLRAVRFALRFNLTVESKTRAAIMENAAGIEKISAERIREELTRILTGPRPGQALRVLDSLNLLRHVLPEIFAMKGVEQPREFHPEGDVFVHTGLALDHLPPSPSAVLAWATLLHDVGKPATFEIADRIRFNLHHSVGAEMAEVICRRFHFSNSDRKQIVEMVQHHMEFMNVRQMRPSRLRRLLARENFGDHLELHRADCLASHGDLGNYEFCKQKLEEFGQEDAEPVLPPAFLNGNDLIAMGYQPGPEMGKILRALCDAQLNNEVKNREEAEDWVRINHPL